MESEGFVLKFNKIKGGKAACFYLFLYKEYWGPPIEKSTVKESYKFCL